jgi:uncharacterized protein involved in type VI secretion and phage assembly
MSDGLFSTLERSLEGGEKRFYGVAPGIVTNNLDQLGRVKVRMPWFSGSEESAWARVAVPMAGLNRGTYFIPQVNDEVLLAFEHGDIRHPYVIGSLWNVQDFPPEPLQSDPIQKRTIRTLAGHEIAFDDIVQSITITSSTQQKIEITPTQIEVSNMTGTHKITIDNTSLSITIQATAGNIELKAPAGKISLQGLQVEINGTASTDVKSAAMCNVQAPLVKIN